MTNFEYYKDKMLELVSENREIGLHNGVPMYCSDIECCNCDLDVDDCSTGLIKWLYQEYEPHVDWSKVKVDTPIYVSDDGYDWRRRYFAKYENGKVYAFQCGATSWSSDRIPNAWKLGKLSEVE